MGILDRAGKFAEKAGAKIGQAASGVADKSKIIAEKTKLKSQISTENSNINKAYAELGKKYYEVAGSNPAAEYESIVSAIKASMAHIEELQQQIASIDAENTCPNCGAAIKKDQQFCQACGHRTASFVDVPASDVEVVSEKNNTAE